jgi:hypothetical protein
VVAVTDRKPSEIIQLSAYQFSCEKVPPQGSHLSHLALALPRDIGVHETNFATLEV